ncbi:MAG: hypothetical protein COB27_004605 [Moritella sp.]|nr:hypothetical protein [Moritella sp.]
MEATQVLGLELTDLHYQLGYMDGITKGVAAEQGTSQEDQAQSFLDEICTEYYPLLLGMPK